MKFVKFALFFALLPALLSAQERVTVKGRIINGQGEAVEYVQVGIPKLQIGTISTVDGRFEINVPCDTLEFFHVSYQAASYPVTGADDDVVIVLQEQELPPAVFIGGDTKEKYLLRPGANILKNMGIITTALRSEHPSGREIGSVAKAKKPFLVKDILLTVHSNHIPGCVASINIYRIEGKKESFVNMLHKPIYFDVAVSDKPQDFDIQPEETILLEPGRYFIAFQIVGYDEPALQAFLAKPEEERKFWEMSMDFNIYLKSSFIREVALGEMESVPVNIGVAVKGLEFQ
ncbi:MAG: carboxypeptidase-like regulatory domain-containing protein [Bacteroidales bacterium]|nr:carboxypeptidase-like regulatory domain-containing protein [Bacteroidales bacterium]